MPFVLIILGALLIISAIRNTHAQLGAQFVSDLTGPDASHSFLVWIAALLAIGALGYVPALKTPSRMLLGLVLLVILISNRGFFAQFVAAIQAPGAVAQPQQTAEAPAGEQLPAAIPVQVTGAGGSGSGGLSGALGLAKTVGGFLGL